MSAAELFDPVFVPPEGPGRHPRLYLVGEAPGAMEAREGRPFSGPAGEILRELLREAGIDPAAVRIFNAVPFRPIDTRGGRVRNRTPGRREIRAHARALLDDIERTRPAVIVALGNSARAAFGIDGTPLEEARRRRYSYRGIPLRVTYHPQYVRTAPGGRYGAVWRHAVEDLRRSWMRGG